MPKHRRLYELYVTGTDVTFEVPNGPPEIVWLQKLNTVEHEAALRYGMGIRQTSQELLQEDSDAFKAAMGQMRQFGSEEVWRAVALTEEFEKAQMRIQAELAAEDEWSKDDRLQALTDAWLGTPELPGLKDTWVLDPDNEEAKAVLDALKHFDEEVEERLTREKERLMRDFEGSDESKLLKQAARELVRQQVNKRFARAYQNAEIFYATRTHGNHSERYFDTVEDLDLLPDEVRDRLVIAYNDLIVDVMEGKDSGGTGDSSPPSEQLETAVDSSSSSPTGVTASKTLPGT